MDCKGEVAVAQLLSAAALTQVAVAERCGVTRQAVSSWSRGLTWPDRDSLGPLVELLVERLGPWVTSDHVLGFQPLPDLSKLAQVVRHSRRESQEQTVVQGIA